LTLKIPQTSHGLIYVKAPIICLANQAYEYPNSHDSASGCL